MNLDNQIIDEAFQMASSKNDSKASNQDMLLDLGHISNQAKLNKYSHQELQKAFYKTLVLATAYSIRTQNRFFCECFTMTFMNAYGSSDFKATNKNITITNLDSAKGMHEMKIVNNIKKLHSNDMFFTQPKSNSSKIHALTNHDVYFSIHHALLSLKNDHMATLDDLGKILGKK